MFIQIEQKKGKSYSTWLGKYEPSMKERQGMFGKGKTICEFLS